MTEVDPELLEILVCPACHATLRTEPDGSIGAGGAGRNGGFELVCTGDGCGLVYPVRDGIPVLLIEEARQPQTAADTTRGSDDADGSGAADGDDDAAGDDGDGGAEPPAAAAGAEAVVTDGSDADAGESAS